MNGMVGSFMLFLYSCIVFDSIGLYSRTQTHKRERERLSPSSMDHPPTSDKMTMGDFRSSQKFVYFRRVVGWVFGCRRWFGGPKHMVFYVYHILKWHGDRETKTGNWAAAKKNKQAKNRVCKVAGRAYVDDRFTQKWSPLLGNPRTS